MPLQLSVSARYQLEAGLSVHSQSKGTLAPGHALSLRGAEQDQEEEQDSL